MSSGDMVRWGPDNKFRAPVPPGMTLEQAQRKIDAEYGDALRVLANATARTFGVPPELMPLAWFCCGDVVLCAACRVDIQVGPTLLRCPECGRTAATPEGWS